LPIFQYLLHFYKLTYNGVGNEVIYDTNTGATFNTTRKIGLIGYGYVENFTDLVLCPSGSIYDINESSFCKGNIIT